MRRKQHKTTTRNFAVSGILLMLFLCVNSCQKEDYSDNKQNFGEHFFAYNGQTNLTKTVIGCLRARNDSATFAEKFAEKYGMPVWEGAVDIYEEDATLLFVPVRNKELEEIETIWMFKIKGKRISYCPLKKEKLSDELKWGFDYFTQEVLMKKPQSGLIYSKIETTRAYEYKCVKSWAGHGTDRPDEDDWKEHCWWKYVEDDTMEEAMPGDAIDDGGGYTPPGYGDAPFPPGGGGGGYSPGTPEVIPDKSLDNPDYKNVKDVFDCIVMNAPSPFIKNMLNRFYGNDAEFDITYLVGEMPAGYEDAIGLCDFSASGASGYKKGTITFNKDELNTSSLELISTLLHETLHAYIHSYLYSKDPNLKKTTLDEAFDLYEEKMKKGATADQEHNFMATNWVNTMASELQQFHATQESYDRFWEVMGDRGLDVNNKSLFYEAMAWNGLKETKAYKNISGNKKETLSSYQKQTELLSKSWQCK